MFPADQVLEPLFLSLSAYGFVFVLGTLFGSFANVCIHRWPPTEDFPRGRSIVRPGSHCPFCGHPVRWYDNVPLFAYIWLRGRCRDCSTPVPPRYLLVEASVGVLFAATYHHVVALTFAHEPLAIRMTRFFVLAAFQLVLVIIAFIDLDHKLILDKISVPGIVSFYFLGLLFPERLWYEGLIGAAAGYGVVRLISDGYYLATKREGMGYGDGKLLALIGALWGWQAVAVALFLGSLLGSLIAIPIMLGSRVRGRGSPSQGVGAVPDGEDFGAVGDGAGRSPAAAQAPTDTPAQARPEIPAPAAPESVVEAPEASSWRHVQIPFGPFLALGAVLYIYAQPWLHLQWRGL